ncbi:hypothetical protein VTI74DRAFT_9629 [Chaetomium olivicolor]
MSLGQLSARTLLVKVTPAPATLPERRAVLQVLKKHGEVEVFKRLLDPSHFISVVESGSVANKLLLNSPLKFDFIAPRSHRDPAVAARSTLEPKTFHVRVLEKPEYAHRTRIRQSLIYGPWPQPPDTVFTEHSLPRAILRRIVPRDMAWKGLIDWESAGQLDEVEGVTTQLGSHADYIEARMVLQRNRVEFASLVDAYEAKHGFLPQMRPVEPERQESGPKLLRPLAETPRPAEESRSAEKPRSAEDPFQALDDYARRDPQRY